MFKVHFISELARRAEILRMFRRELRALQASVRRGNYRYRDDAVKAAATLLSKRRGLGRRYFTFEVSKDGRQLSFRAKRGVLELEKRIDGTTVLRTSNREMTAEKIVAQYKELSQIEDSFRELADFIELRPMYHRKERRVRSHVFICVLSYLLEKILQRKLDVQEIGCTARRKALTRLKKLQLVTDRILDVELKRPSGLSPFVQQVIRAVGLPPVKQLLAEKVWTP